VKTHVPARPPYDPEFATLPANGPLPIAITPETSGPPRAVPFTAPIEEVLGTRNLDHEVCTTQGLDGDAPAAVSVAALRARTTWARRILGGRA
jgi:hypothetical protein